MNIVELQIAKALSQFLATRANRIACDNGVLEIRAEGYDMIVTQSGKEYDVEILVTRRL